VRDQLALETWLQIRFAVRGLEHPDESLGTYPLGGGAVPTQWSLGGLDCTGRALAGAPNLATRGNNPQVSFCPFPASPIVVDPSPSPMGSPLFAGRNHASDDDCGAALPFGWRMRAEGRTAVASDLGAAPARPIVRRRDHLLSPHGIVHLVVEPGSGELIDGSAIGREGMVGGSSALDANISIRLAGNQGRSCRMGLAICRDRRQPPVTRQHDS
jgi:hypothetical protein